MIDITIPYWFPAASCCLVMICGILLMIYGLTLQGDARNICVIFGIIFLFAGDGYAATGSSNYMSTSTTGSHCCESCSNHWPSIPKCVYPTVNPYEQQPLHPIAWCAGFVNFIFTGANGAIKLHTEYV